MFTIIPGCGNCREYLGGDHTDVGAHHYDFAQCALETDHSGLVEIIPLDDPVASTGVRYLYKNGVEMIRGARVVVCSMGKTVRYISIEIIWKVTRKKS